MIRFDAAPYPAESPAPPVVWIIAAVGVLPTFFFALPSAAEPWTVGALTVIALVCLYASTERRRAI